MTGAVKSRTSNLGLGILNFNFPNWGDDANKNTEILDTAFTVFGFTIRGNWDHNIDYFVGDLTADIDEGNLYRALVDHTSSGTGTFAEERAAFPLRWEPVKTSVSFVGIWTPSTVYSTNQFLIDHGRYGVVLDNYTSTFTYDNDVAQGHIATLVDVSNLAPLGDFAQAVPIDGGMLIGDGLNFNVESGVVLRAHMGLSDVGFPPGTRMLFQQTNAPTAWTKETIHNDKTLRVVSGPVTTGGSVPFSTAFASKAVTGSNASVVSTGTIGNTALSTAQLPAHVHGVNGNTGTVSSDHSHAYSGSTGVESTTHQHLQYTHASGGVQGGPFGGTLDDLVAANLTPGGQNVLHTHSFSGQTGGISANHSHAISFNSGSAGSGAGHNHTLVGDAHTHVFTGTAINLAVNYVDIIIGIKD